MLTTITLPPEYDDLPGIARLWLHSRYNLPPEKPRKKPTSKKAPASARDEGDEDEGGKDEGDKVEGDNDERDKNHSKPAATSKKAGTFWTRSTARPVTKRSFIEALDLLWLLGPRWKFILNPKYRHILPLVVPHFAHLLFKGLIGVAGLWVRARLMSTIEGSFATGQSVPWRDAAVSIGAGALLAAGEIASGGYFARNRKELEGQLDLHFKGHLLELQLSQTVSQVHNRTHQTMLYEAGTLVGDGGLRLPGSDVWIRTDALESMEALAQPLQAFVEILAYFWLLVSTVRTALAPQGQGIASVFATLLLSLGMELWKGGWRSLKDIGAGCYIDFGPVGFHNPYLVAVYDIEQMAEEMQEVIFFGLGAWIMARWYDCKLAYINYERRNARLDKGLTIERLETLTNFVFQTDLGSTYEKRREPGGMRFEARGLSVTYPGNSHPSLHGIDLEIKAGETLALVGFNGSGKTTLAKALLGMRIHAGTLLINGIPIEDYKPSSLHARMSCIFQDFEKYNTTLNNNIGVGLVERINDKGVVEAALVRGGANSLLDSGLQLETKLNRWRDDAGGEDETRGRGLSGGQWQRIALARAFMRAETADFIVFDEPSSALDPAAEAEIFDRIYDMAHRDGKRTTTVFVSHGFGNVRRADRIAFVAEGTITECGTHDELMRLKGEHHRLFKMQSRGYVGDGRGGEGGGHVAGDETPESDVAGAKTPESEAALVTPASTPATPATPTDDASQSHEGVDAADKLLESIGAAQEGHEAPAQPAEVGC
ncbi:hypothetical protein Q8F55_000814 [Vanrija albida]|uniref:ABC transporter domain-containing protein n=1 Tax=Vanrija albida TaxID=181172 RepID=A0ABR3QED7_9TREE